MAFVVAGSAAVLGQASSESEQQQIIQLPSFSVTEGSVDPFNASDASSSARVATKIQDSVIATYVVTPALIQDINPESLWDVTQYFAGVSANRATGQTGFNDRQTFRGIESFGITVDDFSRLFLAAGAATSNFNNVFLDRAELIMGPDAILQPTGTGGGSLNVITKSPQFTPGVDLSVEVGNYQANQFMLDATGPLGNGGHLAYRLIAGYQDSTSYTPGTYITETLGAELTYKFSDSAKLTFKYFGDQDRLGGTVALSALDGEEAYTTATVLGRVLPDTPQPGFVYSGWNGDANWSKRFYRDNWATLELTTAIGAHINMRLAGNFSSDQVTIQEGYPSPVLTETFDPATGVQTAVTPINPTAVPLLCNRNDGNEEQYTLQNDFAGKYTLGGVGLEPLAGWAYVHDTEPLNVQTNDAQPIPPANLVANNNAWTIAQPQPSVYTTLASCTHEEATSMQLYAYLRASFFNDRLFATGGAGRTWINVNDYTLPYYVWGDGVAAGNPKGVVIDKTFSNTDNAGAPTVQPWHDAYIAGLLYKVLPNLSAYYNYSSNNTLAQNAPLWQAGSEDEYGIKTNFFNNRLSITADHFQIKENNVTEGNPLFNIGQSTINFLYSNLTNHGEELNIQGGITKNLSVIASYTNMHLRDLYGRRQRNIPDNMANLMLDYHFDQRFLKGVDVFAAVTHSGDFAGETVTGVTALGAAELPGYYESEYNVVNAGVGYAWKGYHFNLNVDNVLNSKFWWQAQSRSSVPPYPGTTVTFTVKVHFL